MRGRLALPAAMLTAATVAMSVLVAPPAQASSHRMSVRYALHYFPGTEVTNSAMLARATIERFAREDLHKRGRYYDPIISVSRICRPNHPCPQRTSGSALWRVTRAHGPRLLRAPKGMTLAAARSALRKPGERWYNPFSWDWGHIIRATWHGIWKRIKACLVGALAGTLGKFGEKLGTAAFIRGATLRSVRLAEWQGYAVTAVAGCLGALTVTG